MSDEYENNTNHDTETSDVNENQVSDSEIAKTVEAETEETAETIESMDNVGDIDNTDNTDNTYTSANTDNAGHYDDGNDGRYGYTRENMPYKENDFRHNGDYNGYSNNNGYTNDDYSSGSYTSEQTDNQQNEAFADRRAMKAAKKQEKIRMAAEKKAAKKQKQAMKKQQGPGFGVRMTRFVFRAILFGVIAGATMIGMGYGYDYFYGDKEKQISMTNTATSVKPSIEEDKSKSELIDETKEDTDKISEDKISDEGITITDVSDIVDEVMPSVVSITSTEIIESAGNDFWSYFYGNGLGGSEQYESQGAGSGIIVGENDEELLIVTNQHVVADADSLSVQFCNEKSVEATIRGENEKQDIAVLSIPLDEIDKDTISEIKIATLGDSDKLKVGEGAIAIGNALGYGQSVTTGVISALDRTITVDNYDRTVIQTDAAINPGNSGGALLNMQGEVIGINCAKSTQDYSEGMGYTIPISLVKDLIDDMMTKEVKQKVDDKEKGYLNIYGKDVTSDLSQMYDIPEGVYIMEVIEGGAAQKAGISKYDVITAVEGETISSMEELQSELEYYKKGEKIKLTIETLEKNEYVEKEVEIELAGEME